MAARAFGAAVARDGAFSTCAAALGVSTRFLEYCADEDQPQALALGDIYAVHLAGFKKLALGLARDMVRVFDEGILELGLEPSEHAIRLAASFGVYCVAVREGNEAEQRAALDALRRRLDEAQRDADRSAEGTAGR